MIHKDDLPLIRMALEELRNSINKNKLMTLEEKWAYRDSINDLLQRLKV